MLGRLSTGDRIITWSVKADGSCVLCRHPLETVEHLFSNALTLCKYGKC